MRETGQGQRVAAFVEETGITTRGRLVGGGVIEADGRAFGHQRQQGCGRAMQDQRPRRRIKRGDVFAARGAQLFAEPGLCHQSTYSLGAPGPDGLPARSQRRHR